MGGVGGGGELGASTFTPLLPPKDAYTGVDTGSEHSRWAAQRDACISLTAVDGDAPMVE